MRKMKLLPLALALASVAGQGFAADTPATRQLIDQAIYWQQKGQDQRAAEAWEKLLRIDPAHGQALVSLGQIAARAQRFEQAASYYQQAAALPRPPAGLSQLQAMLQSQPMAAPVARPAAVGTVSRPTGPVQSTRSSASAYASLAGTAEGWETARRSLEELLKSNPGDLQARYELARVMTYRERTRREGVRQLSALAARQPGDQAVREAWRQALLWMGGQAADRSLIVEYLGRYPDDDAMRQRLQAVERQIGAARPSQSAVARQAGFSALDRGDNADAEAAFRKVLANRPGDVDALGGLGVIHLRREDFAEAARYLDQAIATPQGAQRWQRARSSAHYWLAIQAASDARSERRWQDAEQALQQAIALDRNEPTANVMLADLLRDRGDMAAAEAIYRRVLGKSPTEPGAFRGLLALLANEGRESEARGLIEALKADDARRVGGVESLRSARLLREAEALEALRDYRGAAAVLEDALLREPGNRWVRLALAQQYRHLGSVAAASALLDDALQSDQHWPEGLFAQAQALATEQRWLEALRVMERIPGHARNEGMQREQHRFWINAQADRARAFASNADMASAGRVLMSAESAAGKNPEWLAVVAAAWADLGQASRGLRMLRDSISSLQRIPVGVHTQYAGLLLRTGQDTEAGLVLREIATQSLTRQEEKSVNDLIIAYTLRLSDSLREQGRLADAYDALMPTLQASNDARLWMALARLHLSGGDADEALSIAERVLAVESDAIEHRLFAAGAALAARDVVRAQSHSDATLQQAPDNPRVLAMAAQVAKARGDTALAIEYAQYAMALEREQEAFLGVPGLLALQLVDYEQAPESDAVPTLPRAFAPASGLLPLPEDRRTGVEPPRTSTVLPSPMPAPRTAPAGYGREGLPLRSTPIAAGHLPPRAERTRVPRQPLPSAKASESSAQQTLNELLAGTSPTFGLGIGARGRTGEVGMSQLDEAEVTLEARWPFARGGEASVRVSGVSLDAGPWGGNDPSKTTRFGSTALGPFLAIPPTTPETRASGAAVAVAYRDELLAMDLTTTPQGFELSRWLGGLSVGQQQGDWGYRVGFSRRAVTDSLLSYAGTRDPLSGAVWGGVTRAGGHLNVTFGDEDGGLYGELGRYQLRGSQVLANVQDDVALGGYWRWWHYADSQATIGLHLGAQRYRENLSHFTLGHGGYFSPQRFISLSVPFTAAGRRGALSYQFGADVGVRHIRQDQAAYFPANATFQADWLERLEEPVLSGYPAYYAASDESGWGLGVSGAMEYLFTPDLAVGGRLSWDNSRDYRQYAGMLYLRYGLKGLPQTTFSPRSMRALYLGEAK